MTRLKNLTLTLFLLAGLSGYETRSKLVAKNVYSQSPPQLTLECKHSIKSVELRQLAKNSFIALMPVAAILSGGLSIAAAAAVNGGIYSMMN